ncbi:unnamed protein product [Nippostrongylus brasiliensis]|uniref:Protocadherin-23 (inferred by orthology to a human protein) n=1 Tax=Nippostrongylus brasiliensis TaxID=27835 RepID=A0A158QYM0_NIPBR|nr:unnamed protein product [Nippostrongylus brasiliensis]
MFNVESMSGTIYGSTGTCLVSVRVLDVNDNLPIFYPTDYNATIREGHYEIVVQARDGSGATSQDPAHVHIFVIDPDTTAPSFTQSNYVIKTPEDILPGISIGSVLATGPGAIRYSIYSGDLDHQFMIHPDSGRITVARYLDADKNDRVVLNVKAELQNGGSNHTQVLILIEDHNDNAPKFPLDMLEITNGVVVYSILSSHPPCPVMIQPLTGQLQFTDTLDYETTTNYRIRVKAQDQGVPPRSANMTLILHVSDFNDNSPKFEHAVYEAEVPPCVYFLVSFFFSNVPTNPFCLQIAENSAPMTAVLRVKANDLDSRENGKLLYRITNGSSPPLSSSATVRISVTDVNDNAPSCNSVTSLLVPYDSAPSTTVGTVVISDPDTGANGTVVYRSQQSHPLFIVKGNGDVHLRRALVDSDPSDIRMSIIASDQGSPRKSTVCHVQIQVSNHFKITAGNLTMTSRPSSPPPWSLLLILSDVEGRQKHVSVRVLEPNSAAPADPIKLSPLLPIGSKVASLAHGASNSGSFFYALKNDSEVFELDQSTGELYLMRKIRDLAGQQLSISYNRINRSTYESDERLIEFEGQPSRQPLLPHQYRPPHRRIDSQNRMIDSRSINIRSPYHLVVLATIGSAKASVLVVVNVEDKNNNHPEIISSSEVLVLAESNRVIHHVVATDDDFGRNAAITYDLILDPSNCFAIDHDTVLAKSSHGDIDSLSINVRVVESEKSGPRISSASCGSTTVPENRPLRDFKQISALGVSNSTRFSIRGRSPFFSIDAITGKLSSPALDREKQSEHLLVIVVQDGEAKVSYPPQSHPQYSIPINSVQDSCTVRITVTDENDNIPQLAANTPQIISINASTSIGDVIHRFNAFDHDVGVNGRIFYSLVEDASMALDLAPESGELTFVREPSEVGKDWMIRVRVYDKGIPSLGVDRLIRIQNSRAPAFRTDSQPAFLRQKYVAAVDEGLSRGQIVSKVSTSSRDSRITYSIVEGNTDSAFEVDGEGVVRTSQELDFEIKERYELKIIATGAFSNQIQTQMTVEVNNVNDNSPVFPQQRKKKVLETLPIGSYVTTVTANDADNLAALEYSLDPKEERFTIDRFTGVVHLATGLDFETVEEIKVNVKVSDGNFTSATSFMVVVMDVNDNAPEFQQRFVDIKIPQSAAVDDVLAKLVAFDRDSGENGRISYSLAETYGIFQLDSKYGTLTAIQALRTQSEYLLAVTATDHANDVFDIDQMGRLSLKSALDRELKEIYSFTVDVGSQSLASHQNSSTTVTIRLSDVNDNFPMFDQPEVSVTLRDGMKSGEVLQRLTATDADTGENGRVSYRILSGDDYGIFSVGAESGALIFNQWDDEQLARHEDGRWTVFVEATDHGSVPRTALLAVRISVNLQSWSGSAPFFVVPSYVALVAENTEVGSEIFRARATNRFGITVNTVRYLLKDSGGAFAIEQQNGSIRLKQDLDFETRASYKMSLSASDGNVGPHGIPRYRVEPTSDLVSIEELTGLMTLKSRPDLRRNHTVEQITVIASSSHLQQTKATTSSMASSSSSNSGGVRNSLLFHRENTSSRSQPDSGIDQDTVSVNSSVTEYLISIGVNPNPIPSRSRFRRPDTIDSALNEYIYARVEDILPPGPLNLSENVDQLESLYQISPQRLPAPTFKPLTEIFDELEEIQREQSKKRDYVQVEI